MDKKKLDELAIANKELAYQNEEKGKRAAELIIANKELVFQNEEKENRAAELNLANIELAFQNKEKGNRAAELGIANKELVFQNKEKENREAELILANKELVFQNNEKENRAAELSIANKELAFQNEEKENRAAELIFANIELNQSQELLQNNLREIADYKYALDESTIIAIADQKGIIKKANSNFCKISKYSEEELIGQDHRIINSGYHTKEFIHDLWVTIANGKIWKGEFKNKAKDGTFYWVDTTIVPFLNEQGKPYQYLSIRVDITDRKEAEEYLIQRTAQLGTANKELALQNDEKENRAADLVILSEDLKAQQEELRRANDLLIKQEEKVRIINLELSQLNQELEERVANRTKALAVSENLFRNMMETIPQIAWTNTVEGKFTFYNQRWYDYTGLDYGQTKAWGCKTVIHPDDLQNALDQYRSIRETSDGGEFQIRGKRADGVYRWHLIRLMPIKHEEGEVQLWVGTATDIQELRLLQQQKDDFISIASHELKTPITSLKASLQLLNKMKDNPSPTMLPNLIGLANKSLDKVSVLIQDLLNANNVNEGQLHQKLFIISQIIDECCQYVRAEGIYTIKIEGDMEIEIYADAERVNQVVINFVNNAIKYAPESKEIKINIEKVKGMAKVSVTDEGHGISADKLAHLFDRYYRVDSNGSQYSGLGLGLYISAEIIKKHNGQIGVDSELGKGSTFWFTLPCGTTN